MLSDSNARLAAARRLTSRKGRRAAGLFLAEGAPAVQAALARPDVVTQLFVTADAAARHADLLAGVAVPVDEVSPKAAAALSETVTPQGLLAVCRVVDVPLAGVLAGDPHLVAALVDANDPGNAGTILRTADAAGADAVVFAAGGVDPYNGKVVRASAGSIFHVHVASAGPEELIGAARAAGLSVLAATGHAARTLDEVDLARPVLWLFGNEARGLPPHLIDSADDAVRVPIYGAAESLNLSVAAALCLYATAQRQRRLPGGADPA